MKELLFTFPGKVGDNLLRLPVAYQYCKQNSIKTDICLDTKSEFLISLFQKQKWVDKVFIDDGVWDYSYGGQPYDFRKDEEWKKEYEKVFHLGFLSNCYGEFADFNNNEAFRKIYESVLPTPREHPLLNITLISAIQSKSNIELDNLLTEPSIEFEKKDIKNLCIHIKTQTPERNIESKESILYIYDKLLSLFETIYIIGKESDKKEYLAFLNNNKTFIFDDGGDLNKTVDILSESILIGTYGSMWALANCMKIKQVIIWNHWDLSQGKSSYDDDRWILAYDYKNLFDTIKSLI